ncbi:MAG TPA: aminoacyl-tRNA hydrolase [Paenirhodobacter sp.]
MQLWVGLGNPGAKYAGNRHNIGFMAVDRIATDHGFGPWKARFQGQLCEGRLGTDRVILLKPETFMNLSGQSVRAAADFYKIPVEAITVFHDELDIAPSRMRIKMGGGHAGHNGLRSIHAHMGEAYRRIRLGIGHPGDKAQVANYVLADFAKSDQDWIEDLLRGISEGAALLAAGEDQKFLNIVSLRTHPPRSSAGTQPELATAPKKTRDVTPPDTASEDSRTPLQKLSDRFRR